MAVKKAASEALRSAITRLLAGNPMHADGELTWNNVCLEAGIPRSTAARAADLIAQWKGALQDRARQQNAATSPGERLRQIKVEAEQRARQATETHKGLRNTIRAMANHIQALTLALEQKEAVIAALRKQIEETGELRVIPLPQRRR